MKKEKQKKKTCRRRVVNKHNFEKKYILSLVVDGSFPRCLSNHANDCSKLGNAVVRAQHTISSLSIFTKHSN